MLRLPKKEAKGKCHVSFFFLLTLKQPESAPDALTLTRAALQLVDQEELLPWRSVTRLQEEYLKLMSAGSVADRCASQLHLSPIQWDLLRLTAMR